MTCWVYSHAVKVPATSKTKVSFSNDADAKTNNAKVSFSNDAYVKTNNAKVSFSNDADAKTNNAQVSFSNDADAKTNNTLSFRHTASSTLQLVVTSVDDKLLKGSTKTNNALSFRHMASSTLQLVVASVVNKFSNGSTQPSANNSRQCRSFVKNSTRLPTKKHLIKVYSWLKKVLSLDID